MNLSFNQLGRAIEHAQEAKWRSWKEIVIVEALKPADEVEDDEDDEDDAEDEEVRGAKDEAGFGVRSDEALRILHLLG